MIKPIETFYGGVRFRSRLEARWAVYFDAMGVTWEYEPEKFQLPDGRWYIPDFRLQGQVLIEVKPPGGSFEKAEKLGCEILLLEGPPRVDSDNVYPLLHTGHCDVDGCGRARPPDCSHPDWAFVRWNERRRGLLYYAWGAGREAASVGGGSALCSAMIRAASKALSERFGAH